MQYLYMLTKKRYCYNKYDDMMMQERSADVSAATYDGKEGNMCWSEGRCPASKWELMH